MIEKIEMPHGHYYGRYGYEHAHSTTSEKSGAIALWVIVAVIVVAWFIWLTNRKGEDKADLAAAISNINGRVDCLAPQVRKNEDLAFQLATTTSGLVTGVADITKYQDYALARLNQAVFTSRMRDCGGSDGSRFIKTDDYCLNSSSLKAVETCG